jgi:ABC-type transport system involved in cytochrome bd biosynthesis fused ATPase/permease subunit
MLFTHHTLLLLCSFWNVSCKQNVTFSYPTRPNKVILNGMKLKIYRGETVALVGTSGGGKSTVMGMLERFYDPSDGVVEYFGTDIKSLNVHWTVIKSLTSDRNLFCLICQSKRIFVWANRAQPARRLKRPP